MTDSAAPAAQLLQQGRFHHSQGELARAMDHYTQVLRNDPTNTEALYYVAVVACQEGQFQQGIDLARRALSVGEPQARLHNLIGKAHERLSQYPEAARAYEAAIAVDPDFAEAHGNRANLAAQAGFPDEALKSFDKALALDPTATEDWINRGALLHELGRHAEALESFDKALMLAPNEPHVMLNRANALVMLGRLEDADTVYEQVIVLKPKMFSAYLQKGLAAKYRCRFDEARTLIEHARTLAPDEPGPKAALADIMLLTGDWRNGWPLYEARESRPQLPEVPAWRGEPAGAFRLVLLSEGRVADAVMFSRYAAVMAGRGYDVTLLTRHDLVPLLSSLPKVERVADNPATLADDKRPMVQFPLQSVMGAMHLTPDTVPQQCPYLSVPQDRAAAWAEKLAGMDMKVGICWQGETAGVPLANFAPLAALRGVRLIALHTQGVLRATAPVPFAAHIERPLADANVSANTMLDIAAIIANLDLVIGVDALPIHMAGALGKPAWLALPQVPDWRWMLERADSPWYPTLRLFRQDEPGQWAPVFADIAQALRERLSERASDHGGADDSGGH
jgi:tetratricopeptide (TPR) repeat protein